MENTAKLDRICQIWELHFLHLPYKNVSFTLTVTLISDVDVDQNMQIQFIYICIRILLVFWPDKPNIADEFERSMLLSPNSIKIAKNSFKTHFCKTCTSKKENSLTEILIQRFFDCWRRLFLFLSYLVIFLSRQSASAFTWTLHNRNERIKNWKLGTTRSLLRVWSASISLYSFTTRISGFKTSILC